MKIVIVGGGNVGSSVARSLYDDGDDVVIVENDPERADKLDAEMDVTVITGNGSRPGVLEEAGVKTDGGVDCLIACTDRDEVNIMACWLAKRAGVKRVISRARDLEFTDTPDWARDLGIDVMSSPERSLSKEISDLLSFRAALYSSELFNGKAGTFAFEVEEPSLICGMSLKEVGAKHLTSGATMVYVERGEEGFIPFGDWVAQPGDVCFVVALREEVLAVQKLFYSKKDKNLSKVIIIGGGKLGANLANRLTTRFLRLKVYLIDKNPQKCAKLAAELPKVIVLNGDGLDERLLINEGVHNADGVVAATENDELNVIIGTLAKKLGCKKVISVVKKDIYSRLEDQLAVDVLVNPNDTLASVFLLHVRYPHGAGTLSLLDKVGAEILEITLPESSPALGIPIVDLNLPKGVLIAMIDRKGKIIAPRGGDTLQKDDMISLFATTQELLEEALSQLGVS